MARKLTQLEKAVQLNTAVNLKDLERVRRIYERKEAPTYTGAALGNAACYGGPDIVRFLLENGASFEYRAVPSGLTGLNTPGGPQWFWSLPVDPDPAMRTKTDSTLSDEERAEVVTLLNEYGCRYGFRYLLHVAIQYRDRAVADTLLDLGFTTLPDWISELLNGMYGQFRNLPGSTYEFRDNLERSMKMATDEDLVWMIRTYLRCDEVKTVAFRKTDLYNDQVFISRYCKPEVFPTCLACTNIAEKATYMDLLNAMVCEGNAASLIEALQQGWCRSSIDLDDLMNKAHSLENPNPEVTGALVEYMSKKRKPTDRISLDQDLFAAGIVRRSWNTARTETGVELTSYKGTDVDVVIPPRVGKQPVTSMRAGVFDPNAPRLKVDVMKVRRGLRSVVFPDSLESIPPDLFHSLDPLVVMYTGQVPTWACPAGLETIVLPEGVRRIEEAAFWALPGLLEVDLPSSLEYIGDGAFSHCQKLKHVHFPEGLKYLGNRSFEFSGLTSAELPAVERYVPYAVFFGSTNLEECTVQEGCRIVGEAMFCFCEKLTRVELPETLEIIDKGAFRECSALKTVELPNGLKRIEAYAFAESGLERIVIPKSVQTVGAKAFHTCRDLKEVIFLGEDTKIEPYAFVDCENLSTVSGTLKRIPDGCFSGCYSLKKFDWGNKLRTIGAYAFTQSGLTSAMLPDSVHRIEKGAFIKSDLHEVRVPARAVVEPAAFDACPGLVDEDGRTIVRGTMYGMDEDYHYLVPTDSADDAEIERVRGDYLNVDVDVRVTKLPPRIRLDREYPEQDIIYLDGPRPEMKIPTREQFTTKQTVQFGVFPQTPGYELKPITWDVVSVDKERVLLLSRMELMYLTAFRCGVDNNKAVSAWKDSRVRRILNEGFVSVAFSEEEKKQIIPVKLKGTNSRDLAIMLTVSQVLRDVSQNQRCSEMTKYAKQQCPNGSGGGANVWLARVDTGAGFQAISAKNGSLVSSTHVMSGGIRPAVWVRLPKE